MKEPMDILKVYNLVNANGDRLQLKFGRIKDYVGSQRDPDKGYRWSFDGTKIPMPVRNRTWFNGFPEETMLNWLKANGWYPRTCVSLISGRAIVYDLPDELDKANESSDAENELSVYYRNLHKKAFEGVIVGMINSGRSGAARSLYAYAHSCCYTDADKAVTEIMNKYY